MRIGLSACENEDVLRVIAQIDFFTTQTHPLKLFQLDKIKKISWYLQVGIQLHLVRSPKFCKFGDLAWVALLQGSLNLLRTLDLLSSLNTQSLEVPKHLERATEFLRARMCTLPDTVKCLIGLLVHFALNQHQILGRTYIRLTIIVQGLTMLIKS